MHQQVPTEPVPVIGDRNTAPVVCEGPAESTSSVRAVSLRYLLLHHMFAVERNEDPAGGDHSDARGAAAVAHWGPTRHLSSALT